MEWKSKVEEGRVEPEMESSTTGKFILPSQMWRDERFIPHTAPDVALLSKSGSASYGDYIVHLDKLHRDLPILRKYKNVTLKKVKGTESVFQSDLLKDVVPFDWDRDNGSYNVKVYVDGEPLSYSLFFIDGSAGTVTTKEPFETEKITVDFYKYIGRKGAVGTDEELEEAALPFPDDLTLLKNAEDDEQKARFLVRGGKGEKKYILPETAEGDQRYSREVGYTENDKEDTNVIVTQENLNGVLHKKGIMDGGVYL